MLYFVLSLLHKKGKREKSNYKSSPFKLGNVEKSNLEICFCTFSIWYFQWTLYLLWQFVSNIIANAKFHWFYLYEILNVSKFNLLVIIERDTPSSFANQLNIGCTGTWIFILRNIQTKYLPQIMKKVYINLIQVCFSRKLNLTRSGWSTWKYNV